MLKFISKYRYPILTPIAGMILALVLNLLLKWYSAVVVLSSGFSTGIFAGVLIYWNKNDIKPSIRQEIILLLAVLLPYTVLLFIEY